MVKRKKSKASKQGELEYEEMRIHGTKCNEYVGRAQYRKAFLVAKDAIQKYPNNRFAMYKYAVMLGDSGEWASKAQQEKNRIKAAKLFRKLLRRTRGIGDRFTTAMKNEYFWFSKQPLKQYRLGEEYLPILGKSSCYSMGVGAVSYAKKLYARNRPRQAKEWAKKAVKAWQQYFTVVPSYYNSHVWHAKALGLLGDIQGMEQALKKAAKLAKRPLSYREFVETREDVYKILGLPLKKMKKSR